MIENLHTQLPTLAELRAVALTIRRRTRTYHSTWLDSGRERAPDERLCTMLDDPFDSVSDVSERLGAVETYLRDRGDRRSVFLTVYTEMTANVYDGIESGAFEDPEWVRDYLVDFADRYRSALLASERGNPTGVPVAWHLAFGASTSGDTVLIQDALLGVSAHINYDLVYALRDVGIDPKRQSKLRDHNRINGVLQQLVDVVQRALADVYDASGYTRIDALLGSFDEEFTLVGLREARSLAWRNAVLLTDTESALIRRVVDWRVEAVSIGAGHFILAPSADESVIQALRSIERERVPIDSLRDAFDRRLQQQVIEID
jgi:hypothetical protein